MVKKVEKGIPTGVKVISILTYIGFALLLLAGIAFIVGGSFAETLLPDLAEAGIVKAGAVFIGIVLILFAVLNFFIARGLWKGHNWARITTVIFLALAFIGDLMSLIGGNFSSIIALIIYGLIGYYLLFNKDVKKAFS